MRVFEEVAIPFRKHGDVKTNLPERGSAKSAGYDFCSKINAEVQPGETVKIWTDVKARMEDDDVLLLDVRSSMGGKWVLTNTIGVIDSDYYSNVKNDGNIGIFLKNISNEPQRIEIGDRIAQGIFTKYLITDNDNVSKERVGGFGSTGI